MRLSRRQRWRAGSRLARGAGHHVGLEDSRRVREEQILTADDDDDVDDACEKHADEHTGSMPAARKLGCHHVVPATRRQSRRNVLDPPLLRSGVGRHIHRERGHKERKGWRPDNGRSDPLIEDGTYGWRYDALPPNGVIRQRGGLHQHEHNPAPNHCQRDQQPAAIAAAHTSSSPHRRVGTGAQAMWRIGGSPAVRIAGLSVPPTRTDTHTHEHEHAHKTGRRAG